MVDTTFQYQGILKCYSLSGDFREVRSDVVTGRAAPTSATSSQAGFTFIGSYGVYSFNLSGTLTDNGGSASGRIGASTPNENCAADINVVFGPGQPFS